MDQENQKTTTDQNTTEQTTTETTESTETTKETKIDPSVQLKQEVTSYRSKLNESSEQIDALKSKIEQMENDKLKSQNNYKSLWEKEKERADGYHNEVQKVKDSYISGLKESAIETAAIKHGIDPEYMHFLKGSSESEVQFETTSTGKVNILGADDFVERFKTQYPKMFMDKKMPTMNTSSGNYSEQKQLTPDEILALQKKGDIEGYNREVKKLFEAKSKRAI